MGDLLACSHFSTGINQQDMMQDWKQQESVWADLLMYFTYGQNPQSLHVDILGLFKIQKCVRTYYYLELQNLGSSLAFI